MGATIREQFSDAFTRDIFGVVTGTSAATAFPNQTARLARFVAYSTNIGSFFLGQSGSSMTLPYELDASVDTGWFAVRLGTLASYSYRDPSGSSDYLAWWAQY